MTVSIAHATAEDVEEYFGRPAPFTIRCARVAKENGVVIALVGVFAFDGRKYVFSDLREEALKYRKLIVRTANDFIHGLPKGVYYAKANEQLDSADRFLRYLGFEPDMDLYRIEVS